MYNDLNRIFQFDPTDTKETEKLTVQDTVISSIVDAPTEIVPSEEIEDRIVKSETEYNIDGTVNTVALVNGVVEKYIYEDNRLTYVEQSQDGKKVNTIHYLYDKKGRSIGKYSELLKAEEWYEYAEDSLVGSYIDTIQLSGMAMGTLANKNYFAQYKEKAKAGLI